MSEKYISSIINNYGDVENMRKDAETLRDILNRQGSFLILEVLANNIGENAVKFKLTSEESLKTLNSMVDEFKELTWERI